MAQSVQSSGGLMLKVGMDLNHNHMQSEFYKVMNKLQKDATINMAIKVDNDEFTKTVEHFEDEMGNLVEVTNIFSRSWGNVQREITNIQTPLDRLNAATKSQKTNTDKLSRSQQNLNTHVKQSVSLFQDFTNTFLKMAKFNTINLIYDGLINKMSEAIEITNNFDKAMTEFKKVTDTSNLSLSDYTETLGELGEATARSATQMLEATTEFSKGGYDAKSSAQLAQVATLYQNIADAEISAGESASFIISQMKAFGVEANNATSILDKVNEVSNNFAVSSTDVTSALTKQSASLAAYGNDLNESIALVTAGTEIMTGQAGKVARGLRTIGANITQLAQGAKEFEIQVGGATRTIQLWNDTGTDMLNTYQVLEQISDAWDDMTNAEKSSLAITLAKKTQMDTFLAVMGNFEDAEKAYVTALNSEGSALKENEAYMESIEAHQAQLKAQWEQLVLSTPFEDLEKTLLSTGTTLLKFANSDIGQTVIKITSLITVMLALNAAQTAFNKLVTVDNANVFLSTIAKLIAGETTLTQVTVGLTTAMLANPLFWGAVAITGVVLLIQHIKKLSHAYEEHVQELREVTDEYKNQRESVDALVEKLQDIGDKLQEINQQKLEITDEDELKKLEQESEELSEQHATLKNQLILERAKTKELEKQAKLKLQDTLKEASGITNYDFSKVDEHVAQGDEVDSAMYRSSATPLEGLKQQLQSYENLKNKLDEVKEKAKSFNSTQAQAIQDNLDLQKDLEDAMSNLESEMTDNLDVAKQAVELNDKQKDSAQTLINQYDKLINSEDDAKTNLDAIRNSVEDLTDTEEESSNAWDTFLDKVEDIQSAYETLNKAAEEYNENGYISASTLKKLNKLQPEYIAQLQNVNGKMEVSNDLLQTELDNQKQLAINSILVAKQLRVQAICQQYVNEKTEESKQASEQASPQIDALAQSFNTLAQESRKAGTAVQYAYAAIANDEAKKDELQKQLDEVDAWADGMIDSINAVNLGVTDSSSKAASSTKDAWVEAFKEEQRQLKHALEMNEITEVEYYEKLKDLNEKYFGEISGKHQQYLKEYQENEEEVYKGLKSIYEKVADYLKEAIEQGYEDAINALKKEEKRVLEEIKAQIEALKDEKKKVLDDIQDQIDGLKKKKDKVQDYWNSQIDKIKEANNALQKQNELLEKQQALQRAKSQKVMVMRNGKFQLGENESAIAQAEQALSEYQDQTSYEQQITEMEKLRDKQVETIDDRIEKLEEHKKYMEKYYDEQIDALEKYRDEVEKEYEKQIEALQEELDAFKRAAEEQKKIEEARLAAQVLGVEKESDLFKLSLSNLKDYVAQYNNLVAKIKTPSLIMSGAIGGLGKSSSGSSITSASGASDTTISTRAVGDSNFRGNEIALVGESPNAELIIGSHLNRSVNSGTLMNLSRGSGVVNAESTSTLAGILNGIVKPTNVANNRSTIQSFSFGNITLPNVTDADSFVNTLSHKFNNYAIQYGNSRK